MPEPTEAEKAAAAAEAAKAKAPPAIVPKVEANDSNDLVDRLVQRYGNERAALAVLADENFQYRTRHRDDQTRFEQQAPLLVTKEEKELLAQYKTLGTVVELEKFKKEHPELTAKIKDAEDLKLVSTAAGLVEYKDTVLADQMKSKGFVVEIVKEKNAEGEDAEVPYAKFVGKDDSRMKLTEFAEKHLADYIPALTASDDARTGDNLSPVVIVPRQIGQKKSKAPANNPAKAYLTSTYKTPGEETASKSKA